jgi:hypothetical protein
MSTKFVKVAVTLIGTVADVMEVDERVGAFGAVLSNENT